MSEVIARFLRRLRCWWWASQDVASWVLPTVQGFEGHCGILRGVINTPEPDSGCPEWWQMVYAAIGHWVWNSVSYCLLHYWTGYHLKGRRLLIFDVIDWEFNDRIINLSEKFLPGCLSRGNRKTSSNLLLPPEYLRNHITKKFHTTINYAKPPIN